MARQGRPGPPTPRRIGELEVSGVAIDVAAVERVDSLDAGVDLRTTLHEGNGCPRLVQRVLRLGPGASFAGDADRGGELWYLKCGTGRLEHGSHVIDLQPDTAAFFPEQSSYRLLNDGDNALELTIVGLPAGIAGATQVEWRQALLAECEVEITGDRRFSVLI